VFISHVSEDKDEIVHRLAIALHKERLKIQFDEFELTSGDSLRRKIDKGLTNSRLGMVVLSKDLITKQEVINYSPSLADRLAPNTAVYSIKEIAPEI
jgi:asparagine synthetase A